MLIEIVIFFLLVLIVVLVEEMLVMFLSLFHCLRFFVALKGGGEGGERQHLDKQTRKKNLHVNFPVDILVHTMHSLHQRY